MRLESLDYCVATFENTIQDEKQTYVDAVNRKRIEPDDPELSEALFKLNYHILPTFRNCMIVAVCTLIEDILLAIGSYTVPDFESHVGRLRRRRMSTVRRYLQVLESQLTIDFTFIDNDLLLIDDIVKIRNAITHAWGKIDNCDNHVTLRKIISRRNWVQETGDGYILVSDEAYADAIEPVLRLVRHIFDSVPVSDD